MPKIKRRNLIVMKKEERGRRRKGRREENTNQNLTIAAGQNIIDNNRFLYKRNLNSFTLTIIRVHNQYIRMDIYNNMSSYTAE